MIQKIKNSIMVLATMFSFGAVVLVPATALAANNSIQDALCEGTNAAVSGQPNQNNCAQNADGKSSLAEIAGTVVNFLSIIVGIVAVIMIIFGGFRYITSGGDSGNVSSAKNTLIYAIVGLIIVALAQFIVRFVLNSASGAVQ